MVGFGKELVNQLDPIAYNDLVNVLKKHNLVLVDCILRIAKS